MLEIIAYSFKGQRSKSKFAFFARIFNVISCFWRNSRSVNSGGKLKWSWLWDCVDGTLVANWKLCNFKHVLQKSCDQKGEFGESSKLNLLEKQLFMVAEFFHLPPPTCYLTLTAETWNICMQPNICEASSALRAVIRGNFLTRCVV